MTIFVDPIRRNGRSWGCWGRYLHSCHLFTDGPIEELHTFAHKIGLRREWFQNHRLLGHYDLTPQRHVEALKAGAKELSWSEFRTMLKGNRLIKGPQTKE